MPNDINEPDEEAQTTCEYRCPACKSSDALEIQYPMWGRLIFDSDGSLYSCDTEEGDHEWEATSPAHCFDCGHFGTVGDFTNPAYESEEIHA
jgi:hypothetical protein